MRTLTVCIPVYNGAETIARCLTSVLSQTHRDFECLVIDNASTDSTVDEVRKFSDPRIRTVRNPENVGVMRNHNLGLELARGEVIQYVHADDWLLPNCLERLIGYFDDPHLGLAFAPRQVETSDALWKTTYGRLERTIAPLVEVNDGQDLIRRYLAAGAGGNVIGEPSAVMLRRSTLIDAGGFRIEAPQLSDIDAWLRILVSTDAAFVDEELSVRWHHPGSQTARNLQTPALDRMWVMTSLIQSPELDRGLRRKAWVVWLKSLSHAPGDILRIPGGHRASVTRDLLSHIATVATRRRLVFGPSSYSVAPKSMPPRSAA